MNLLILFVTKQIIHMVIILLRYKMNIVVDIVKIIIKNA